MQKVYLVQWMLSSQQEVLAKFVHVVAEIDAEDDQKRRGRVSKRLGKGVFQGQAVQATGEKYNGENVVSEPTEKENKINKFFVNIFHPADSI